MRQGGHSETDGMERLVGFVLVVVRLAERRVGHATCEPQRQKRPTPGSAGAPRNLQMIPAIRASPSVRRDEDTGVLGAYRPRGCGRVRFVVNYAVPVTREIAYYYPEPYWLLDDADWVKTLLLFFDEVAILLPDYMMGRHREADPSLVEPLEDQGLLRVLHPERFVDEQMSQSVTSAVVELIAGGAFDDLSPDEPLAELSMSRMGWGVTEDLAQMVYEELAQRGLAVPSRDGVSIPMHWRIRATYLLLLAQFAREAGQRQGFDLHPATNDRRTAGAFDNLLELGPMPSRGHVVSLDIETVSIDLSAAPLDEVLGFRNEHADSYRRYMTNLRSFAFELSLAEPVDQDRLLADRRATLEEEARALTNRVRHSFKSGKKVTGFGLGLAGAAWSAATSNPVPAVLGLLGAATGMAPDKKSGNAYSYLFEARRDLR